MRAYRKRPSEEANWVLEELSKGRSLEEIYEECKQRFGEEGSFYGFKSWVGRIKRGVNKSVNPNGRNKKIEAVVSKASYLVFSGESMVGFDSKEEVVKFIERVGLTGQVWLFRKCNVNIQVNVEITDLFCDRL